MNDLIAYANESASTTIHLALWHGFNLVLLLSFITLLFGVLLYKFLIPTQTKEVWINHFERISPKYILTSFASAVGVFASAWTNFFQSGYLRHYVRVVILFLAILIAYQLTQLTSLSINWSQIHELTFYEVIITLVMLGGILIAVFSDSRLTAVAAMGVVGFALCMLFVFYSAPDLAMTQFAIDTLTVILFVLVLYRLPKYLNLSESKQRIRDGILALAFGSVITLLSLAVLMEPKRSETGDFYAESAYLLAKGKNVVNVILVDFRGLDTMVEVSVLVIAALGVFGLLKLRVKSK
jgi:multicomponent Na+:H+ antiporter subunit A